MRRNCVQTADLESNMLKRIRATGGLSRVELARDLGLSPSTAGVYVERLIAEGFLVETEKVLGAGRPRRLLRPNPDGGEFLGVDFEARNIMAVAVDFSDIPLRQAHKQIEAGTTAKETIKEIEAAITEVLPKNRERLLAIGVGVPGIVDSSRGIAVHYKYIAQWKQVPLAAQLSKRFGVPVFLENNARSMALAELWFGQGRGHNDFACIGIRSGIGVGLVANGSLYCGARHAAGEFGRWGCLPVRSAAGQWFASAGGNEQEEIELQDLASAQAIMDAVRKAIASGQRSILPSQPESLSLADIVRAAQQRDALTIGIIEAAAAALGSAIGHLALVFDPAKVVLAGPLTSIGETFLQPLRMAVGRKLRASELQPPEIVNSAMGEYSGALGAAALALHEWKPKIEANGKRV